MVDVILPYRNAGSAPPERARPACLCYRVPTSDSLAADLPEGPEVFRAEVWACSPSGALLRCRRRVRIGEPLALRREKVEECDPSAVLARVIHVLFAPDETGPAWLAGCDFVRPAEAPGRQALALFGKEEFFNTEMKTE